MGGVILVVRGARFGVAVSAGLMLVLAGSAHAQSKIHASLVEDINPGVERSIPDGFVPIDDTSVLFSAFEPASGRELWLSQRPQVASSTDVLKDINPGSGGSFPSRPTKAGRALFFSADDGTTGQELWKTDGTADGTVLVKDIKPGPGRSLPIQMTDVDGTLFFSADDGVAGRELWKSDGTAEGTVLVKDITSGPDSSFPTNPFFVGDVSLVNAGRTLFFVASEPEHGRELWKSDGTAKRTVLVRDINPGPDHSIPRRPANPDGVISANLTRVDDTVIFRAFDPVHGLEPWLSDGTAEGTVLVDDINPGPGGSIPEGTPGRFTNAAGTVLFTAADSCTDPTRLRCDLEPWKTAPRIQ